MVPYTTIWILYVTLQLLIVVVLMSVVTNLKNYLNSCLKSQSYTECTPKDEISSIVASWLQSRKCYKDHYVYLAWFAMRELLLKECKSVPTNGDVVKSMMEYTDEFGKYFGGKIEVNKNDHMWAYNLLYDNYFYHTCIFKIVAVAKKFKSEIDARDFLSTINIPMSISGELQGNSIHRIPSMSANDCMEMIIAFLRESLTEGKWMYVQNLHSYNMLDWIMEICHGESYDERCVQCIYAAVLFILEYGYDPFFLRDKNNKEFWEKHKNLYAMSSHNVSDVFGRVHTTTYRGINGIAFDITSRCNDYGGIIDKKDITINLPEIIMPITPSTSNDAAFASMINTYAAALFDTAIDIIEDRNREQKKYTSENIDKFISSIRILVRQLK